MDMFLAKTSLLLVYDAAKSRKATMHNQYRIIVILLATALAGTASASEIYKWTDDQGNVHYTDTPDHQPSERIAIASRPTDNARVQADIQARRDVRAEAAKAAATQQKPAEPDMQASERAEKCEKYKERVTRFAQSRHLYREDENGEREYLDEAQVAAARKQAQQQVEENCNS